MDSLLCEVRFEADESRQTPGRLTGTLLTYEQPARDRPEIFTRGALSWPEHGIVINEQHNRASPIIRTVPFLEGDDVRIDVALPDTQRGRDAGIMVRNGTLTGLSAEFYARQEGRRGGLREIRGGLLVAAGLVDRASYAGSKVEVRAWQLDREMLRWL